MVSIVFVQFYENRPIVLKCLQSKQHTNGMSKNLNHRLRGRIRHMKPHSAFVAICKLFLFKTPSGKNWCLFLKNFTCKNSCPEWAFSQSFSQSMGRGGQKADGFKLHMRSDFLAPQLVPGLNRMPSELHWCLSEARLSQRGYLNMSMKLSHLQ